MMDRRQCLAGALAALCGLPAWAETALDGGKGPVRIVSTLPAGSESSTLTLVLPTGTVAV